MDFPALQDRTDRQVVELRVDAVLDDDDVFRDEWLELFFDGLADADADVRVIHQLVDAFRPQEFAVVVLPQKVPEMAQVRQFQLSGRLHAHTAEQGVVVDEVGPDASQPELHGLDAEAIHGHRVQDPFQEVQDRVVRVQRRRDERVLIGNVTFFQLGKQRPAAVHEHDGFIPVAVETVQ